MVISLQGIWRRVPRTHPLPGWTHIQDVEICFLAFQSIRFGGWGGHLTDNACSICRLAASQTCNLYVALGQTFDLTCESSYTVCLLTILATLDAGGTLLWRTTNGAVGMAGRMANLVERMLE